MDAEQLNEKKRKAQGWFRKKYRFLPEEDAQDFGAFCIEYWLEGGVTSRAYKYLAIDYLRKHGKRLNKRGNSDAMALLEKRKKGSDSVKYLDIEDHVDASNGSPDTSRFIYTGLTKLQRIVMVLFYEWEFTKREVAHCLGVSPGRISQLYNDAMSAQKKAFIREKEVDHQELLTQAISRSRESQTHPRAKLKTQAAQIRVENKIQRAVDEKK